MPNLSQTVTTSPSLEQSLRHHAEIDLQLAAEIKALETRRAQHKTALFDLLMAEGLNATDVEGEDGEILSISISSGETKTLKADLLVQQGVTPAQIAAATTVTPRSPSVRVTPRRRGSRE